MTKPRSWSDTYSQQLVAHDWMEQTNAHRTHLLGNGNLFGGTKPSHVIIRSDQEVPDEI